MFNIELSVFGDTVVNNNVCNVGHSAELLTRLRTVKEILSEVVSQKY